MQPTLRCLQEATSASGRRGRGDCLVLIPVALRFRQMSISRWEGQTIGTLVPMVLIVRITTFTVIKKRVAGTGSFLSIKTATSALGRRDQIISYMLMQEQPTRSLLLEIMFPTITLLYLIRLELEQG